MAVQESRIRSDLKADRAFYTMMGSAATPEGHLGVQLWIAKSLGARVRQYRPLSPRIFLGVLDIDSEAIITGSLHAPTNPKKGEEGTATASYYGQLEDALR